MENSSFYIPPFTACFSWYRQPFPIAEFKSGSRTIICAAPLLCPPSVGETSLCLIKPLRHSLVLDSNILSNARKDGRTEITEMFKWANESNILVNPYLAVIEQYAQETSESESRSYVIEKVQLLNEKHYAQIKLSSADTRLALARQAALANVSYVGMLADFFIIARYYFNSRRPFETKSALLAKLMRAHLPHLTIAYYISCLYYYVGSNQILFKDGISKCLSDMLQPEDPIEGRNSAMNLAYDISLITSSTLPMKDANGAFIVPYIATGDKGLGFLLKNICFSGIAFKGGMSFPWVQYRPGSRAAAIQEMVNTNLRLTPPEEREYDPRRQEALAEIAQQVLNGEFRG